MNRGWLLAVGILLAFRPGGAVAQVGEEPDVGGGDVKARRALRIEIGGEIDLKLVHRNEDLFRMEMGPPPRTTLVPPLDDRTGPSSNTRSETFIDPQISVEVVAKVGDKVKGVIELKTPFNVLNDDAGGVRQTSALPGRGRRLLDVNQLYVQVDELLIEQFSTKIGIQDFAKDLRGHGNPFLIDVSHSENPFDSLTGSPAGAGSGLVDTQEAAGAYALFKSGPLSADAFFFIIDETFQRNRDQQIWGGTVEYADDPVKAQGTFLVMQSSPGSYLYTLGGGAQLYLLNNVVELFGEGYAQWGDYRTTFNGDYDADGVPDYTQVPVSLRGRDIEQVEAYALQAGARLNMGNIAEALKALQPFVEASYVEVSGDDESTDTQNENFVSMENNNATLIVENGYYGMDIDTNYRGIRLSGGLRPIKQLRLEAMYAWFELQDNNGTVDNSSSRSPRRVDKIGDEIDLHAWYDFNESLSIHAATGWLLDCRALGPQDDVNISILELILKF